MIDAAVLFMKRLFQKVNVLRLLAYFFDNPHSEAYLRQIARALRASPATVMRGLRALEMEGLVVKRKDKSAAFFKASGSGKFKALKTAYTVGKLDDARIVECIREKSQGLGAVLLYGSAARGEDDATSDYDLLVIAAACRTRGGELSEKLGREVSLKKCTIGEWKKISEQDRPFYLDVITSSIALFGNKPVME